VTPRRQLDALPAGGGEMGERIRAFDWASHPFGPPGDWRPELLSALGICLHSSFPTAIYWGPDLRLLYNDAWSSIPGERHPWALGKPAQQVWRDIWDVVGPQLEAVRESGAGFSTYDQMLPMERGGRVQETFWNYSFTPILDNTGAVLGVFNQGNETTAVVMASRERTAEIERLRDTFEHAPGAIAILKGPDHRFEIANAAYIEMIGGRAKIIGRPVAEALPEVAEQGYVALLDTVYRTGEPHIGRGVAIDLIRSGERETRIVDFIYQPTRSADGVIDGVFVQATDVTERATAERELRRRADERTFLDDLAQQTQFLGDADAVLSKTTALIGERLKASLSAYADMDADGSGFTIRGDWAAPGAASIVGRYRLADFGALAMTKLHAGEPLVINDNRKELAPEEAAAFQALGIGATVCMPLVRQGRLRALMAVHHSGPHRWSAEEISLIREVTGRSWAHIERVGAQGEARENERRYQALFNAIDEGFCIIEFIDGPAGPLSDYIHVEANPAYAENAGIPDVVGQRVRDMVPDEAEGWVKLYRDVLITGTPVRFEKELEATGRWLELAAFRVEPPERRQVAVLFKDLTARKRAEENLQALNATLEQRVAEEVAERGRAEDALRQAQKMEAIGQLTGGIAHDFNNMLAVVIGGLNLTHRRLMRGDTDVAQFVEAAIDAAQRAAALTQRLLSFSRQQPLDPQLIDANKLVRSMRELLIRTLGQHIAVETALSGGLWRCFADPVQLESAILNLAVNARDAMTEGGKLTIETRNVALDEKAARGAALPEGRYVVIAVTDTGAGMSEEVKSKAFDPFFTTKAVGKGTGLGLSQVFGFVRQSGGHVKLYSEIGEGTTIRLYLPEYVVAGEAPQETRSDAADDAGGGAETVMVVEDEILLRLYSVGALKDLGYNVIEARSPSDALRMISEGVAVDLLFTDIVMPDMNGLQLAEAALKVAPGLKVLFATGYARNAVNANGEIDPGALVLQKPFTVEELASKVRAALEA
jgi:PAS domain S-box-containing protein